MKQSKKIEAFYNAYNDWLEAGSPKENKYEFRRWGGLCSNLSNYMLKIGMSYDWHPLLERELKEQFEKAHLDKDYPFGRGKYFNGYRYSTNHLDPIRIKWVKSHLTEEVEEKFELI